LDGRLPRRVFMISSSLESKLSSSSSLLLTGAGNNLGDVTRMATKPPLNCSHMGGDGDGGSKGPLEVDDSRSTATMEVATLR